MGTLDEIHQSIPNSTDSQGNGHGRVKRVAPIIAIGAISGVLGTFLGLYSAYEISQLKTRLSEQGRNHNLLVHVTKRQEEQVHKIIENLNAITAIIKSMIKYNPALIAAQIYSQLSLFEARLIMATNAVQQLQHRRLAVDILDTYQLTEMHKAISAVAKQRGYTLLPERLNDYFQLETSYLRQGEDILIMLHVPCIIHDQMLTIYRYIPFPYPLPVSQPQENYSISDMLLHRSTSYYTGDSQTFIGDTVIDALIIIPETDMIAVGLNRKYKTLSEGDLAACVKRNRVYLCEKHQVLLTNLANSCLGSIFDRNSQGVKENCKLERKRLRETVYQLSATDHLLFTPKPYTTQIECNNGSHFPLYLAQTTKIHIPEECKVNLHSHSIQSDYNIRISPEPLHVPWEWDPLTLPADLLLDAAIIDQKITMLDKNIKNLLNETSRPTNFRAMLNKEFNDPAIFPWYIWAGIFISMFAFIGLVVWYCYNSSQQRRYAQVPQQPQSIQMISIPAPTQTPTASSVTDRQPPQNPFDEIEVPKFHRSPARPAPPPPTPTDPASYLQLPPTYSLQN